jgi:hypothetical protein
MHKINTDTATSGGEFTDGDEGQAIPPTDLNAAWFNSVQRELIAILTGMGVSPDGNNDGQLWAALQKIGIRCDFSDDEEVSVSGFSGATAVFHSASDFDIVGLVAKGSLVVIAPYWGDASPSSISVGYNTGSITIRKWNVFVGFAMNGEDDLNLAGVYIPMLGSSGKLVVGAFEAASVKATKRFETSFVDFEYTTDQEGLQGQQAWQLASNWEVGQVKRVRCTNAQSGGTQVTVFGNSSGNYSQIVFYPYSFREFVCVGTYETTGYTWAILAVNGKA